MIDASNAPIVSGGPAPASRPVRSSELARAPLTGGTEASSPELMSGHLFELDEAHRLPMGNDRSLTLPLTGGTEASSPELGKPAKRGTTNGNARGGTQDRARRREWLVATYRADRDVLVLLRYSDGRRMFWTGVAAGAEGSEPACRCYRCGVLLTVETVTVDRIVPGCRGGTYRRSNIRPACQPCNSSTGGRVRSR